MSASVLCPDCGHATRQHADYGCERQRCVCVSTKADLLGGAVYVPSISGPMGGPVVKPRCRICRNTLDLCPGGCSTGTGDRRV